jgi:asparagine synthase (glutamine-hydrolysing)
MCGIGGIVGHEISELSLTAMVRMQAALRRRGPDDQGLYLAPGRQCALVHTRLAILGLGPAGHQPMCTRDKRLSIAFNGEIYNFRELRQRLQDGGALLQSDSDTEVLLYLYQAHGPKFVAQLRGMFAFAIWDEHAKTCFLARDRFGIKPLYTAFIDGPSGPRLVFASELRAITASGLVPQKLNRAAVAGYLRAGSVPEPMTMIEGVEMLPAGSSLMFDLSSGRLVEHWVDNSESSVERLDTETTFEESAELVRAGLVDSLRAHFVSDVPVGMFLSGGIDSTAILALSREVGHTAIRSYSIAFDDALLDEGPIAARTAKYFRSEHLEWRLSSAEALALAREFLETVDQPTVDGFNTWCVSRFASTQGSKVVLSGLGGDELFGGYASFGQTAALVRGAKLLGPIRRPLGSAIEKVVPTASGRRVGEFLRSGATGSDAWSAVRSLFSKWEVERLTTWLLGVERSVSDPGEQSTRVPSSAEDIRETVRQLEWSRYMRNQLLRDADVMSMAWGLELRVPLVDRELARVVTQLPLDHQFRPSKGLLLAAVPEIPEWVSMRRKAGFIFPFDRWMRTDWREIVTVSKNCPVSLDNWYRRWAVVVLQNWLSRNEMLFRRSGD